MKNYDIIEIAVRGMRISNAVNAANYTMSTIEKIAPSKLTKFARILREKIIKDKPYFFRFSEPDNRKMIFGYKLKQRDTLCGRGLYEIEEFPIY